MTHGLHLLERGCESGHSFLSIDPEVQECGSGHLPSLWKEGGKEAMVSAFHFLSKRDCGHAHPHTTSRRDGKVVMTAPILLLWALEERGHYHPHLSTRRKEGRKPWSLPLISWEKGKCCSGHPRTPRKMGKRP